MRKNVTEYDLLLKSLREQEGQYLVKFSDMDRRYKAISGPIPDTVNIKSAVDGIKVTDEDIANKKSELAKLKNFTNNISAKITKED